MLQTDPKALQKEMNRVGAAVQRATARTVQSMSLNAKDRTLAQIRQFDKPAPSMLRPGAYQASIPCLLSGTQCTITCDASPETQSEAGRRDRRAWLAANTRKTKGAKSNMQEAGDRNVGSFDK
jgi:hypothetical protein